MSQSAPVPNHCDVYMYLRWYVSFTCDFQASTLHVSQSRRADHMRSLALLSNVMHSRNFPDYNSKSVLSSGF